MVSFRDAAIDLVRAGLCTLIEPDENIVDLLRRVGLSDNAVARAARQIRRQLCDNPREPEIPSGGAGECVGVEYDIVATAECTYFRPEFTGIPPRVYIGVYTARIVGPLSTVTPIIPGDRVGGLGTSAAPPLSFSRDGSNNAVGSFVGSDPEGIQKNQGDNQVTGVFQYESITRVDGEPDDCGGSNPNGRPFVDLDVDVTYEDNSTTIVNEGGNFRLFAPITNINGELSFPFNLDVGELNLNGEINFNGEVNFSPTFEFGLGSEPDDPPGAIPPNDPEGESSEKIIGAKVYVTGNNNRFTTTIPQGVNPDILIPRAGSVQFLVMAGQRKAWTEDIPVKTAIAFIPCPTVDGALAVAGTPSLGVTWQINPVYGRPPRDTD